MDPRGGTPLGIVPPDALTFARAHDLGSSLLGRFFLLTLLVLPLWKDAHHVRSLSRDFAGVERDPLVATALYAIAALGSVLAVVAVVL